MVQWQCNFGVDVAIKYHIIHIHTHATSRSQNAFERGIWTRCSLRALFVYFDIARLFIHFWMLFDRARTFISCIASLRFCLIIRMFHSMSINICVVSIAKCYFRFWFIFFRRRRCCCRHSDERSQTDIHVSLCYTPSICKQNNQSVNVHFGLQMPAKSTHRTNSLVGSDV